MHDGVSFRRPGGAGAAETFEPRQVREEAAVRRYFRVPPGTLPGHFLYLFARDQTTLSQRIYDRKPTSM